MFLGAVVGLKVTELMFDWFAKPNLGTSLAIWVIGLPTGLIGGAIVSLIAMPYLWRSVT